MLSTTRLALVLILLLALSVTTACGVLDQHSQRPSQPPSIGELLAAARRGLGGLYHDPHAELGQPYEMYVLPLNAIGRYEPGTRMSVLLQRSDTWRVPIIENGTVHAEIFVGFVDGRWQATHIDFSRTLRDLVDFVAKPAHQDLGTPVVVSIPPLYTHFALFNKGQDEQLLELTHNFSSLKEMHVYPTDEVMPQLVEAYEAR